MVIAHTPHASIAVLAALAQAPLSAQSPVVAVSDRSAAAAEALSTLAVLGQQIMPRRTGDRGTAQVSGPIHFRPRETQGVFLRRLPDLFR